MRLHPCREPPRPSQRRPPSWASARAFATIGSSSRLAMLRLVSSSSPRSSPGVRSCGSPAQTVLAGAARSALATAR
jgi:hypothetical protein